MKLLSAQVTNFRCFIDSGEIPFRDLTIFVGENDSGKSSLLDALNVFFSNTPPRTDDYSNLSEDIVVEVCFKPNDDDDPSLVVGDEIRMKVRAGISSGMTFQILSKKYSEKDLNDYHQLSATDLRVLVTKIGLTPQRNRGLNLQSVETYLEAEGPNLEMTVDWANIKYSELKKYLPIFQRYTSSDYGNPENAVRKTLENVYASHFYEIEDSTGEPILKSDYQSLRNDIATDLDERITVELLTRIQPYLPDVTTIEGDFDIDFSRGLNFSGLKIGRGGQAAKLLSQFGEGTRKRAFLSILEWDAEVTKDLSGQKIIKAYDEPDANLHYGAQRDLYTVIERSTNENDDIQSILCTHSLSMIDRAPAISINRVLSYGDNSKIDYLVGTDDEDIREYLEQVSEVAGIRNSSIFYEKAFFVFEGESEEASLPILYKTYTGRSLAEDGIVLINLQTNGQWSNALKFLNKNRAKSTIMLLDGDTQYAGSDCQVTLEKLRNVGFGASFLRDHCFFIGTKEFEDTYTNDILATVANKNYPRHDGLAWEASHFNAHRSAHKFSKELINLIHREARVSVGKPALAVEVSKILNKQDIESNAVLAAALDKVIEISRE